MKKMARLALAASMAWTVGLGVLTTGLIATPAQAQTGETTGRRVTIIFRSGGQVTGELLNETATTVRVRVEAIAGMTAETTYSKADILEMKDAPKAADSGDKKPVADKPKDDKKNEAEAAKDTSGPKVYVLEMRGEFGRDINVGPMEDVYNDIKEIQPDILVLKFNHDFSSYGEQKQEEGGYDLGAFDQLETARKLNDMLHLRMENDPGFKVKPRLVAWVQKALGAAAFLPFACPEIYFTTDGLHGGIGYLDYLFAGRGDEVVREKQRSLRLGRAVGIAEQSGHDGKIMKAMSRSDYVLTVSFREGVPTFVERMPESGDEILLTDDGSDEKTADAFADIIRGRGNDVLTLRADLAYRIGFSKGTADTLDDLMNRMGLSRNYNVVKGRGTEILRNWGRQVDDAEANINRLIRERQRIELKPPGEYRERTEFRMRHKAILRQIQGILNRYQESINPRRFGSAEDTIQQIERLITDLDAQQQADKDRR